ncbi:MAG: hypothetical protein L6W00_09355 [Lentisphaeria bacterium]|nr:MAG: hypothetical protein L6W00_09355 [Lentisphaeria bacterium]
MNYRLRQGILFGGKGFQPPRGGYRGMKYKIINSLDELNEKLQELNHSDDAEAESDPDQKPRKS